MADPFHFSSASTGGPTGIAFGAQPALPTTQEELARVSASALENAVNSEPITQDSEDQINEGAPTAGLSSASIPENRAEQAKTTQQKSVKQLLVSAFKGFISEIATDRKVFVDVKSRIGSLANNAAEMMSSSARIVFNNLQKAFVQETPLDKITDIETKTAAKNELGTLKKGESSEIVVGDKTYVVMKDEKGVADVLEKPAKPIAEGKTCIVYKATSLLTDKVHVLKFSKEDDTDAAQDFGNEARLLGRLNADGATPGVQGNVTLTSVKRSDGNVQLISKGEFYSSGDYQKNVTKSVLIEYFGLSTASVDTADQVIDKKLTDLTNKLNEIRKDPDPAARKKNLRDAMTSFSLQIMSPYKESFGKEKYQQLGAGIAQCEQMLLSDSADVDKIVNDLFRPVLKDLATQATKGDAITITTRMSMAADLVDGLSAMHKAGVIHGDIKPLNFFCDQTSARICDFGGAIHEGDSRVDAEGDPIELQGTVGYSLGLYTEAINKDRESFRCDILKAHDMRQMGVSLYEVLGAGHVLHLPDERTSENELFSQSTYDDMRDKMIAQGVPQEAATIIAKMSKPVDFRGQDAPNPFPMPVTDDELKDLIKFLRANV